MKKNEHVANFIKAMTFEKPDWIPCTVSCLPATRTKYEDTLDEIFLQHPNLFPGFKPGGWKDQKLDRNYRAGRWTDAWGVVWDNCEEGMAAIPVEDKAPIQDWAAFDTYTPPDPMQVDDHGDRVDWAARAASCARAKEHGGLASGHLIHGFMFMRLFYLRGFSNFMIDVGTHDPRLDRLVSMVLDHNVVLVDKWLECGIELLSGGDDMGMQTSLPIRPEDWRRYLKPCFEAIFGRCRDRGVHVYLHSDGHIVEIIPDLVECGVTVINPQIRANTLKGLVDVAKGTVCINLDLDRQMFPFATPAEIKAHIHECRDALHSHDGGLMLNAECAPDVPLANIKAICEALEEVGCGPR
ncbi:MAG: uroporphyrinogen decarboxylase family protein [Planctomycetota bacterium]